MRLLLIVPNIDGRVGSPPYNVALLKSFIDSRTDHKVKIADLTFHKKDWKQYLSAEIEKEKIDLIGISVLSFDFLQGLEIASFIKENYNSIRIVFGGIHAILMPDNVISHKSADIVCIGEGEYALKELLDNDIDCDGIKGLWYKDNGKVIKNEPRQLNEDLDELSFPDWNDFDLEKYFLLNNNHLTLMVSRGCPYSCTYCNNHALSRVLKGKYVRFRSVDSAIDEVGITIDQHYDRGFRYIQFIDDIFILYRDWAIEFCRKYKERGYGKLIKWTVSVRANLVTEEIITEMKEAGCYAVGMGIEAGNDYIRNKIYKRNMSKSQIENAVKIIKKSGLQLNVQFIIGAPYETIDMMEESVEMAKKIDADVVQFPILMPLPGTEIRKMCEDEGLIEVKDFKHAQIMYTSPVMKSKYATVQQIKKFYRKVINYQIRKYSWEGLRMKGPFFLWDLLLFLIYYKPKYQLEIQNAFKFTVNKYKMEQINKR